MGTLMDNLPCSLKSELEFFFAVELSLSQFSILGVVANFAVAVLAILLVRKIGPYAIGSYYLEPYNSVSRSAAMANVLYRIVAPVIICEALFLCFSCVLSLCSGCISPVGMRWLSVAFYWVLLFTAKVAGRLFLAPLGLAFEALASVGLCLLFDAVVISRIPTEGLSVFDNTNVGFQMLISIGFMVVYGITSLIVGSTGFGEDASAYQKERLEKALHSYLRDYMQTISDSQYKKRFESDYLFRAIVLTVMYIEDSNRPKVIRRIENALSYLGRSKTTGIMQCKLKNTSVESRPYLSDEQSITIALEKLSNLWERFIHSAALCGCGDLDVGPVWFTKNWYSIDSKRFEAILKRSFSLIYGDYRGSKSLNCNDVFVRVLEFVKDGENRLIPPRIIVRSCRFKEEAQAYPTSVMVMRTGNLGYYGDCELEPTHGVFWSLNWDKETEEDLCHIVEALRKTNATTIDSIQIVEGVYCRVEYHGRLSQNLIINEGWYRFKKAKA